MQMYRVRFVRMKKSDTIDKGDCIVCANNNEAAIIMVATVLDIPISSTEFEAVRVKPGVYLIGRNEVHKKMFAVDGKSVNISQASMATFPYRKQEERKEPALGVERDPEEHCHELNITASVMAQNENSAIIRLAKGMLREMAGEKQKPSVRDIDIKCDRKELRPKESSTEQNSLYTHLRFFQGGDART